MPEIRYECPLAHTKRQIYYCSLTIHARWFLFDYRWYKCHYNTAHADANQSKLVFRLHIHELTHIMCQISVSLLLYCGCILLLILLDIVFFIYRFILFSLHSYFPCYHIANNIFAWNNQSFNELERYSIRRINLNNSNECANFIFKKKNQIKYV